MCCEGFDCYWLSGQKFEDLGSGCCVMAVKFVGNTYYMFSVGKDRLVKYWDADKFELLLTLEGHHSEIWCLAVSSHGDFLVTGYHDRSIRRWDRTEEPFFIEEEKEKRLKEMFETDMDNAFKSKFASKEEIPEEGAVALAGKKTGEIVTATDSIMDALDIAEEELKRIAEYEEVKSKGNVAVFRPNILMLGNSPSDYVLRAVSSVRTNNLEQALLVSLVDMASASTILHAPIEPRNGKELEKICLVGYFDYSYNFSSLIPPNLSLSIVHHHYPVVAQIKMARPPINKSRRKLKRFLLLQQTTNNMLVFLFAMYYVVISFYLRNKIREIKTKEEKMIDRMKWMCKLTLDSDAACISELRMDRATFRILCDMVTEIRALKPTKNTSVEEVVAMFIYNLAHHKKCRTIGLLFSRSTETVSRQFHQILIAVLRLHHILLKKPVPITQDCQDERWKKFQTLFGSMTTRMC
ncbi:hypothetical protein ACS0TY_031742 [Phlomoides rotata]